MTNRSDRDPGSWRPALPWEGPPVPYWMVLPQKEAGGEQPPVQRPPAGALLYAGPGCKAADSCLLVHGYLVHLAEGKSGFGVLKVAKARLEEGAAAARQLGKAQLADEMRATAQELVQVRTPEAAAALAPRLKALSDQTWDLGRRCGGHASPQALDQARKLGAQVMDGRLTRQQAEIQLTQHIEQQEN